jgi:hypothetical protein
MLHLYYMIVYNKSIWFFIYYTPKTHQDSK